MPRNAFLGELTALALFGGCRRRCHEMVVVCHDQVDDVGQRRRTEERRGLNGEDRYYIGDGATPNRVSIRWQRRKGW